MNINLASQITDYRIDAYGVNQYERIQEDQKTLLSEIEDTDKETVSNLESLGIKIVSELLDADMDNILNDKRFDEDSLDAVYEAVQSFIEREIEIEDPEEELDIAALDLESEASINSDDEIQKDKPSEKVAPEVVDVHAAQKDKPVTEDME